MFKRFLGVIVLTLSMGVYAQEQAAIRINESGLLKILKMAVQYNTSAKNSRNFAIPKNIYKFTIPKAQIEANPIIPIVNQVSDLNLNRDINFYLQTSNINVTGTVDPKSIRTKISNSSASGFDFELSISVPQVVVNGANLSLCENKQNNSKNCGNGLKTTVNNLKITTTGKPIQLGVVLRLKTDGKVARVLVRSVKSNLDSGSGPNVNINFDSIIVPKISITIDGVSTELDTSKLKSEILAKKVFLAKKMLSFAADFIANDLAEMLNVYLVNKEVATEYQLLRKENPIKFDEFLSTRNENTSQVYKRTPIAQTLQSQSNPMNAMLSQVSEVIRNAQVGISFKKISTPGNKDIELSGLVSFILNNRQIKVNNLLGNSNRQLPKLDLNAQRKYDVNLAISEPLLNGALDLVNSTKLFQEVFQTMSPVKGFYINNIKIHFAENNSLVAVVNAQVDLKKIQSNGMVEWVKNKIAAWLERNNNNSIIYFPIEVSILPIFKTLPNGGTGMDLKILSPFNGTGLQNRYQYATNVPDMNDNVREGVMEELRSSLGPYTNKSYNVDLTKYLNQSGVVFLPKTISINQSAYLMLNLDLVDIKFNSLNPRVQ